MRSNEAEFKEELKQRWGKMCIKATDKANKKQ